MNKQTEALRMAKQHIIERKGGRGGAVCYVKSDEDVIKAIDEALEQQEARLVSYAPDKSTCTLNIDGEEVYFNREQPAQLELPQQRWSKEKEMIESWQQPAQEPVAWMFRYVFKNTNTCTDWKFTFTPVDPHPTIETKAVYTHPAPSWQGLKRDDVIPILEKHGYEFTSTLYYLLDDFEQALKEKNYGNH